MTMRFNTQTAELAMNQELCKQIHKGFFTGQSVRHIAAKYGLTEYAVRKLAHYWQEKKTPQTACGA